MTMKFVKSEDLINDISLQLFIGRVTHKQSDVNSLVWMLVTGACLLSYLGWFSVLKFRRVKKEALQFEQTREGIEKLSMAEKKLMLDAVQIEAAIGEGQPEAATINFKDI